MAWHISLIRQQKGAVLVEAALTMLVFLLLIFGIVEIGRLLQVQHSLTNAAREGARFGVLPLAGSKPGTLPTESEIQVALDKFIGHGVVSPSPVVAVSRTVEYTTVTITCPYKPMTGLFPFQVNLVGSSTMRNETAP